MLEDYDSWAAQGCVGWSGEELLPYFNRLEDDLDFGDAPYHGRGGPIPICRLPLDRWGAQDRALRSAALDLGYGWSDDHNAPGSTGVSPYAMNCRDGVRVSTNDAYLEPARDRPNLTILGETLVDRVLFRGSQAIGVRARTADGWTTFAAQEVILSAGVFHSAAILLRSGIGPAEDLQELGIPVLKDAPVGHNLVDHAGAVLLLALRPEARPSLHDHWSDCCVRYSSGLASTGQNDMMIMSFSPSGFDEAGLATGVLFSAVFQAFSRGRLRLMSADPDVDPEIDLGLLSDERDLARLRDGVRRLWALVSHPAMQAITENVMLSGTDQEPSDVIADDEALDAWLMATVSDTMHPVGTCCMGAPDDPRTVVDPDCRVIGIEGLRVIDGAIMPEVPRANTHLTCVMIAERMAASLGRQTGPRSA